MLHPDGRERGQELGLGEPQREALVATAGPSKLTGQRLVLLEAPCP